MSELNEPGLREPGPNEPGPNERAAEIAATEPPRVAAEPPPPRRSAAWPALIVVVLLVLAAAIAWTWQRGEVLQRQVMALEQRAAAQQGVDPAQLASLQSALDDLRSQVRQLAARPAATPVDLGPIEKQLNALEHRPAPRAVDLGPIEKRLDALEHRPPPPPVDLAPLEARIAALEQRPQAPSVDPALAAQVAALAQAQKATEQQAKSAEAAAHSSATRAARVQLLQQAASDLAAGKPLGAIPDAPPALARFATVAPPTEAGLRLSFPHAAQAAEAASVPSKGGLSFAQRVWQRAQSLVTVREGNKVIVGAPAAATLAAARAKLDAGDLAGAVTALDALDPAAAQAMAPWREQAQALLDARAALAHAAAAG